MIKLLFLINTLECGGAERVLVNLVNNIDCKKYDITVMTLFDVGVNRQHLKPYIKYKTVFKKMLRGNSYFFKALPSKLLYRFIIKENYDILIAYMHGIPTKIISGCKNESIKKIAWLHTDMEHQTALSKSFWSLKGIIKAFSKFNAVVGVSKTVADSFMNMTGIKDNVFVKYNTNDVEKIKVLSTEPVDDWKPLDNKINIFSIGRLIHVKGFDRLLNAHKKLIEEGIACNLYIIGDGEDKKQLQEFIDKNSLNNSVFLLGFKENPYKYMIKCDLFVCSSRYEGLSTALSEAIILEIPSISTMCSGADEVLRKDSEFGLLVKNDDESIYQGLKQMLTSDELLNHYKIKAKERKEFFSVNNTVSAVEELFTDMITNKLPQ